MTRSSSPACTFLTGGDVAPDRKRTRGLFGRLAPLFREADFAFVNLEHALARSGRLMKGKPTHHRGKPELVEGLAEAGLDALALANNHILDFGAESLEETLRALDARAIPHTGAGRDLAEAREPVVLERNGLRVGLLAYSSTLPQGFAAGPREPGVNPLRVRTSYRPLRNPDEYPGSEPEIYTRALPGDLRRMRADVRRLRKEADAVLVYQHWGASMQHRVHDHQREIGRAAIDAGADAVFGGHQHVLSAIEFHRGRPIVHGTGNLIFDIVEPFFTEATHQTFLLGGTLTKGGPRGLHLLPCRCGIGRAPALLSPRRGAGRAIVQTLARLSEPFGVRLEMKKDKVAVLPPGEGACAPMSRSRPKVWGEGIRCR